MTENPTPAEIAPSVDPICLQDLNDAVEMFVDEAVNASDFDDTVTAAISSIQADRFAALRDAVQAGNPIDALIALGFKVDAGLIFKTLTQLERQGDVVYRGRGGVDSWLVRVPALEAEDSALDDGFEYSEVTVVDALDTCDRSDLQAAFVEPGSESASDPWQGVQP